MLNVNWSSSTSFADKLIELDSSSLKDTSSICPRTGASFTAFTVTVNTWESLRFSSKIKTVTSIVPLKSASGTICNILFDIEELSAFPSTENPNVKSLLSTSEPDKLTLTEPSSSISWLETKSKTGASLTALTVRTKDCSLWNSPSKAIMSIAAVPDQFVAGVITIEFPENSVVTSAEWLAVKTKNGPSTSTTSRATVKGTSSSVSWSSIAEKTIASLTGKTFKTKSCVSDKSPSDTVTVTKTSPLKSWFGIIDNWFPSRVNVAFSFTETEKVKSLESISSADKDWLNTASSLTDWFSIPVKTGASLTGLTMILTTPTPEVQVPSVTVNVIASSPK